jgi:response regulator RpfG family c-di-GMP phosphodiesterase
LFSQGAVIGYADGNKHVKIDRKTAQLLRILLVEDKPTNQKVVNLMLTSMGHEVSIANNGVGSH